jgi:H+/Cl- antiporter ClcA
MDTSKIVEKPLPKKSFEEMREERRRARWSAFWTPFITLASIVSSVGLLMFFVRACQDRLPFPLQQGPRAPIKNQSITLRLAPVPPSVGHQIKDLSRD